MRKTGNWPRGAFACALALGATSACRPLGAGSRSPAPDATQAPRTRTASDASVERDQSQQSFSRIEELIEGRAPGVRVIRSEDGTFRLRIRGVSTPTGNNDPLIVIDGTPTVELRGGSALTSLNPQDVVKIEVLKDAASTAYYGMRGGNGVIVITTRRQ
jgi:TonB-dependent SusC/RagA subfamily outer membrane receptor